LQQLVSCPLYRRGTLSHAVATAGDLFDDVVRLFAAKIRNRQITVTVAGGESLPYYGVIGQIRQVMANLVSNALDAVSVGGRVWLEGAS
jgi:signal transduction histidine kinase